MEPEQAGWGLVADDAASPARWSGLSGGSDESPQMGQGDMRAAVPGVKRPRTAPPPWWATGAGASPSRGMEGLVQVAESELAAAAAAATAAAVSAGEHRWEAAALPDAVVVLRLDRLEPPRDAVCFYL